MDKIREIINIIKSKFAFGISRQYDTANFIPDSYYKKVRASKIFKGFLLFILVIIGITVHFYMQDQILLDSYKAEIDELDTEIAVNTVHLNAEVHSDLLERRLTFYKELSDSIKVPSRTISDYLDELYRITPEDIVYTNFNYIGESQEVSISVTSATRYSISLLLDNLKSSESFSVRPIGSISRTTVSDEEEPETDEIELSVEDTEKDFYTFTLNIRFLEGDSNVE